MRQRAWIATAVVGLALAAGGCVQDAPPEALARLADASKAYNRGDDERAIRLTSEFLSAHDRTLRADEAYYLRGMARFRQKDLDGAREDLNEAVRRTNDPLLRGQSLVQLGEISFARDDLESAERMFDQALSTLPRRHESAGLARYRMGSLYQRQGQWEDADVQFNHVIYLMGESAIADRARRRSGARAWTIQLGSFRDLRNAEQFVEQLAQRDLEAEVRPVVRDGRLEFPVQAGRHTTYSEAVSALWKARQLRKDAFVTTTR